MINNPLPYRVRTSVLNQAIQNDYLLDDNFTTFISPYSGHKIALKGKSQGIANTSSLRKKKIQPSLGKTTS